MTLNIGYLGLAGVAGAGKDTVYERLRELGGDRFVRLSVADPLKESVAALFNIDLETLDDWKRDAGVHVGVCEREGGFGDDDHFPVWLSMREFLQRYGTEAHRDVFGSDFWLDEWERRADQIHAERRDAVVVNTSVRFYNEAQRIIELGGQIWLVEGPQDRGAGNHPSEKVLPGHAIEHVIDNEQRFFYDSGEPDYEHLDDQIATILKGGSLL